MNKILVVCIAVLSMCSVAGLFAQGTSSDEAAIRAIIAQFEPMWTTPNGVTIFLAITSDHYTGIMGNTAMNRSEFIGFIANLSQNNPVATHSHTIKKILIHNAVAYEYGTIEFRMQNGQTSKGANMNVFIREPSGWKLVFSAPLPLTEVN